MRRPGSRWSGIVARPSVFQAGHIPSWRGPPGSYALSPVAACRWWLLLLSPLLLAAVHRVTAFLADVRGELAGPGRALTPRKLCLDF
jgi:hypothetical protein